MPYISLSTSCKLTPEKREAVKAAFGRLISIIPGKSESGLMVDIADGRAMYMRGEAVDTAFLDIRLFGGASLEAKQKLTAELFMMLEDTLGLDKNNVYMTYGEYPNWGLRGSLV
ncbi:MAG: hypothetical protein LBV27_04765 [Oscillospiraceae bacterium]|jgi:phenylpyruvate tautomerase PptA (4-oxalocrotonate tautomerase family)|nr:hypothetical protein [Oscillospiraceae bacterium]